MIKNDPSEFQSQSEKLNGIWRGVIEDNNDPEKRGRCKIRVFGLHTEKKDKTQFEGIPTNELPWSEPALGLIEGSISGYGLWSVPLQGSHVFLFFENGNILQPKYFATVPGIPSSQEFEGAAKQAYSDYKGALRKNAKDLRRELDTNPNKIEFKSSNELGEISKRWESGPKGALAISSGKGDPGGVSYGSYQFASKRGTVEPFVRTLPPEIQSNFVGKTPGTPAYNDAWIQSVNQMGKANFEKAEHDYVKVIYYDDAASRIYRSSGINADEKCPGVRDLIWSASVQHGQAGANKLFRNAGVTPEMSSTEIIKAVYKERSRVESYFPSASPEVREGVRKRFAAEQKMALAKCDEGSQPAEDEVPEELLNATEKELEKDIQLDEEEYKERFKEDYVPVGDNGNIGFSDPNSKYPLAHRLNEPDYHRLMRENPSKTSYDNKKDLRITDIQNAQNQGTWSEPEAQYTTQYPHNIVLATHSGLLVELDSTPDNQRFHLYHPSNTYIEITADGNITIRNTGSKFELVDIDKNTYVKKDMNSTIGNNVTEKVGANKTTDIGANKKINIVGNYDIEVGGNCTINVEGNCNVSATKINFN